VRAYVWRCRKRVDPSAFLLRKGTAYKSPERGGGSRIKKRPGPGPGRAGPGEMVQVTVTRV